MRRDSDEGVDTKTRTPNLESVSVDQSTEKILGGVRRKRHKRRKTKWKEKSLVEQQQENQPPISQISNSNFYHQHNNQQQSNNDHQSSHIVGLASSSSRSDFEIHGAEEVTINSKRDSSSSLGVHNNFRANLLTVLGKLVIWRGSRYRPTPNSANSVPTSSPLPTECIGRSTVFFSASEYSKS